MQVPKQETRTDPPTLTNPDTNTSLPPCDELLDVLADEHSREIIQTLSHTDKTAREIHTSVSSSRPTIYRRLNKLESLGVVKTTMIVDGDGHHRKQFQLTVDSIQLNLFDNLSVSVSVTG